MSGNEIAIVLLCLFGGYWAVSKILDSRQDLPPEEDKEKTKPKIR